MDQNIHNIELDIPNIMQERPTNVFECIDIVLHDKIKEEIEETNLKTNAITKSVCNASVFKNHVSDNILHKKQYACAECGYKCVLKSSWVKHSKPDLTNELKSCEICKQQYSRNACLQAHIRLKSHSKRKMMERSHECKLCDKKFNRSYDLKVHMRSHTGEKPYACSECDKKFSLKHWLKLHMLTHEPVTQFSCQFCDRKFRRKGHYLIHLNIHTREKIYECSKCDKKLLLRDSFLRHMRSHTGEELRTCKICNKTLGRITALKMHMRIHTRENLHKCTKCDGEFIDKSTLNIHLQIHTRIGLKFACQFCEKSFIQNTKLREHMREIHKENIDKKVKQTTSLENDLQNHTSDELKEKSPTHITVPKPNDFFDEITTNTETIKIEKIDLVDTALLESIKTEKCEHTNEKIGSSSLSSTCFEETVCKEEVILPNEFI